MPLVVRSRGEEDSEVSGPWRGLDESEADRGAKGLVPANTPMKCESGKPSSAAEVREIAAQRSNHALHAAVAVPTKATEAALFVPARRTSFAESLNSYPGPCKH